MRSSNQIYSKKSNDQDKNEKPNKDTNSRAFASSCFVEGNHDCSVLIVADESFVLIVCFHVGVLTLRRKENRLFAFQFWLHHGRLGTKKCHHKGSRWLVFDVVISLWRSVCLLQVKSQPNREGRLKVIRSCCCCWFHLVAVNWSIVINLTLKDLISQSNNTGTGNDL